METCVKLFMAIEQDNTDEALKILSENIDPRVISEGVGSLRLSVLQIATWKGQTSLLDLLYERGADVNGTDKLGRCSLHYAAQRGDTDVVKWLLQHGALVDSKFGPSFCSKEDSLKERALAERGFSLGKCVRSFPMTLILSILIEF